MAVAAVPSSPVDAARALWEAQRGMCAQLELLHPGAVEEEVRRMQRALSAGLPEDASDEQVVDWEQAHRSTPRERMARVEAAARRLAVRLVRMAERGAVDRDAREQDESVRVREPELRLCVRLPAMVKSARDGGGAHIAQ